MRSPCHSFVPLAALVASVLATPHLAFACGGLFCNGGPAPVPVEQNSERILFEVDPEGVISTTVEISYTGDPVDFAWVVPVPSTPELEIVPEQVLNLIDAATAPQLSGQRTVCRGQGVGCGGGAVASVDDPMDLGPSVRGLEPLLAAPVAVLGCAYAAGDDLYEGDYNPVEVENIDRVGPYEPTVVSSDDPDALIEWLNAEGYFITESMEPYIAEYVVSGSKFLAMKLAPGTGVSDIAPIRMSYEGAAPMIPLILTAVGAEPEMAITAFVAADSRYQSGNYTNLLMDPAWLRYDQGSVETNYYAVASWLADGVGGAGFFTEYAGQVTFATTGQFEEAEGWLRGLQERHTNLTRLFTRLSPWEMDADPFFEPSEGGAVPSQIDLSGNIPTDSCGFASDLGTCGTTYCGPGAMCARTDDGPGCVCPEGWAAREVAPQGADAGTGIPEITCQRLDHALFTGEDLGVEAGTSCLDATCGGNGECVDLNGFPTCLCDEGFAGVPGVSGQPTCVPIIDTFTPEEALVNGDVGVGFASGGARGSTQAAEVVLGLLILLVPGLLASRRRER